MPIEKIRDGLYVKESFDGYRVVYPMKNDDGTFNWRNILLGGNYWKFMKTLFIIFVLLGISWSYVHDINAYKSIAEDPCGYCYQYSRPSYAPDIPIMKIPFNASYLNESLVSKEVG